MTKPTLFLRIASLLALVEFLGHTALFLTYTPAHGPEEVAVVAAMKGHIFNFGGFLHSYWDLYFGYGLFVSVGCLTESVLLWQMSMLAKAGYAGIKRVAALMALAEAGYCILILKYFFIVPLLAHSAALICLVAALVTLRDKMNLSEPVPAL